jgi:hypothetical protein
VTILLEELLKIVADSRQDRFHSTHLQIINSSFSCRAADFSQQTELSNPSVSNMRKKRTDQKGAPGSVPIASGYTWKTKPGPVC